MLTAELEIELTRRDMINIKRNNAVVYVIRKSIVIKEEEIPIEWTFRIFEKGAKEKAAKKKGRKRR